MSENYTNKHFIKADEVIIKADKVIIQSDEDRRDRRRHDHDRRVDPFFGRRHDDRVRGQMESSSSVRGRDRDHHDDDDVLGESDDRHRRPFSWF